MSDEQGKAAEKPATSDGYEYEIGDKVFIPSHHGNYVAVVVHRYKDFAAACDAYQGSYREILQAPYGKADPGQPHYYCEVANGTRKPLGVAQEHASLKWRSPVLED